MDGKTIEFKVELWDAINGYVDACGKTSGPGRGRNLPRMEKAVVKVTSVIEAALAQARAEEREACAKVAEKGKEINAFPDEIARMIRARRP